MPELPEVQTVASELNRKLKGLKIARLEIYAPKLVGFGFATLSPVRKADPGTALKFKKNMVGQKVLSVSRRAKLIIFKLSGPWSMLVHLKMTGQFIFEDKKLKAKTGGAYRLLNRPNASLVNLPCRYTHVIFYFAGGSVLYFNDVRKFGYLKLVHDSELAKVKELAAFGPEPLSPGFTFEVFRKIISRRPKTKIKAALMDSNLIAGIGNIYSDEILFHSGVRPVRAVATLSEKELKNIFKNIGVVLKKGIAAKGSSVGDFVRTDGSMGNMGKFHFVYGRKGKPCKKCGTPVVAQTIGGRTGSFCPSCQG